ncbi:MAG TPA: hypothetical protein VMD92_10190 [Acidobacteriaceae bacterium]|jgi:hypothetical protein|nr:hypothetical protein [Acidobacteriaceae bacterium]
MRHLRSLTFLSCLAALAAGRLAAQTPARIVFTFDHPQLQPARYTITIDENGAGHFVSQPGPIDPDSTDGVVPAPIDRDIRLDDSLRAALFGYARAHNFFDARCDKGNASLAFTGNKTLSYTGADGHGTCAFVWASDPVLQRLADQLNAVAFTLEIGRRLGVEVRYDRLGLDSELASLQEAISDQRASDLPNIATELQAIAGDQQVMDRARKRAMVLLSRCDVPQKRN